MQKETVRETVVRCICEHLKVQKVEVTDEKHLMNDLGADSLDTVEISIEIEDELEVEFSEERNDTLGNPTVIEVIEAFEKAVLAKTA